MMNKPNVHKKRLIKEKDAQQLEIFNFFSFDEKRELDEKITKLEKEAVKQKHLFQKKQEQFDRHLLQQDTEFLEKLEAEKKKSYDLGTTEGQKVGIAKGEESVMAAVQYLKKCGLDIIALKDNFLKETEETVVKLAVHIAEKVIATEISEKQDIIVQSVRKALKLISDRSMITLKLNESDLESVKIKLPNIRKEFDDLDKIILETDVRIAKGGVIFETNSGVIDARIGTQVKEIFDALMQNSNEITEEATPV